jgi:hypothetical protein
MPTKSLETMAAKTTTNVAGSGVPVHSNKTN